MNAVARLQNDNKVHEGEAAIQFTLLFGTWLKYFGNEVLLREYEDTDHDHEAHTVNIANLSIADGLLVPTLANVVANHA